MTGKPSVTEAQLKAMDKKLGLTARPARKAPLDYVAAGQMPCTLASRKGFVEFEFLRAPKKLTLTPGQAKALADKLQFHAIGALDYQDSIKPTMMQFKFNF